MTEICREHEEHLDRIAAGRRMVPGREALLEVADFFDALGNPTRLKILYALAGAELCTCDLANIAELSVSAISHQLRILRDRKIISFRKEGKNVFTGCGISTLSTCCRSPWNTWKRGRLMAEPARLRLEGLDCANCAAKIEDTLKKEVSGTLP